MTDRTIHEFTSEGYLQEDTKFGEYIRKIMKKVSTLPERFKKGVDGHIRARLTTPVEHLLYGSSGADDGVGADKILGVGHGYFEIDDAKRIRSEFPLINCDTHNFNGPIEEVPDFETPYVLARLGEVCSDGRVLYLPKPIGEGYSISSETLNKIREMGSEAVVFSS
jgi:hypothetical protein